MSSSGKLRLVIADDHAILRGSLRALLENSGHEIIGEAGTGEEVLALASRLRPQVIIMDLEMPGTGGLAAIRRMDKLSPSTKVLILSVHDDEEYVLDAFAMPAVAGYLLKTDEPEELLSALRAVGSGKRFLSPSIAPIVIRQLNQPRSIDGRGVILTQREREVIRLIGQGESAKEIAAKLGISPKTAQVHRDNLKQKLGLRTTADMVRWAIKQKIVRLD
jgi:DNA-binding NarL/FixJ family response regulator